MQTQPTIIVGWVYVVTKLPIRKPGFYPLLGVIKSYYNTACMLVLYYSRLGTVMCLYTQAWLSVPCLVFNLFLVQN